MRFRSKLLSLYARITMCFLRLHYLTSVPIKVHGFLYINANVVTFSIMPTVNTNKIPVTELKNKPTCVNSSLPSTVSKLLHGYHLDPSVPTLLLGTFLPISQSTVSVSTFSIIKLESIGLHLKSPAKARFVQPFQELLRNVRLVAEVNFTSAVTKRQRKEFSFEVTSWRLVEGMPTLKVHMESPAFTHNKKKSEEAWLNFKPAHASPIPLHLTPSEKTELLAIVHNNLLYRINKGLRFVGEADEGIEKYKELKEEIRLWVEVFGHKEATQIIWNDYPGAAVCFLVLAGVYEYSHGEYWELALNAIGIPCNPLVQRYWGQRFLWFLFAFGLNSFDRGGLRYVGPILAHAMIPNDCLPEFFGQLLEPAMRSPSWTGLTPKELIASWLVDPGRFVGVDKPVWQFLRHGGELAEEFVSEAVRMVRVRYETGIIPQPCEFMIPMRIVHQYKIWLEQQYNPPPPRGPFLKLDPYSGIRLSFPDQKLPTDYLGQICLWEVSVAGRRLRGPRDYPQRRGEEAVFIVPELPVPPEGPYEVQLFLGKEIAGTWSIMGMTSKRPWKAFSGRSYKEIEILRSLRAEATWIVIPTSGTLTVKESSGIVLSDMETQRCHLAEDWMGYWAIEVNLMTAATIEICCGNRVDLLNVEHPEGESGLIDGNLLQTAESSLDNIALYGELPPKVFLQTEPGKESASLENVRIRIAGHGPKGSHTRDFSSVDLASASQIEMGKIIIDLCQIIPHQFYPGELTIILWYYGKRLADHRFQWVPGLWWEWEQDGRTVIVHLPEGAIVIDKQGGDLSESCTLVNGCLTVTIPEEEHGIYLVLSWQKSEIQTFSIPLRINGPRWAFLRQSSHTPVWKVTPIEISLNDLLNEYSPCLLLEARDIKWSEAKLSAKWMGCVTDTPTVDLKAERLVQNDRWLIPLAGVADTLRVFQDTDSQIVIEAAIPGSLEEKAIQISVMKLISPTIFRWAFLSDESSFLEWREECIELKLEDLIEGDWPHLLFEAKGGRWLEAEVRSFCRRFGDKELSHELACLDCTERGRWRIDLKSVLEFLEEFDIEDSEIWLEVRNPSDQEGHKGEMALAQIHLQPRAMKTYEDWLNWAESNKLRTLALDLLCDLNYKFDAPVDLLAIDWNISPKMVKRAFLTVKIGCSDVTLIERQNTFRMNKETYHRMHQILTKWNQQRMWKE